VLDRDEEVPIKIRHDESKNITKVQIEDKEEVIRGKAMDDASLFPLRIAHENRDWTLEINVDKVVKQFTLKLNNRPFNDLPDESLNQGKLKRNFCNNFH
jgi:hypothetical protein